MGSRLRRLIQTSSTYLEAGIHEKCVITKYETHKESSKNKQFLITFSKLDANNKELGVKEVSWFIFDPNGDFVYSNLQELIVQLVGILELHYTSEEVDAKFLPFRGTDIKALSDVEDQIKRKVTLNLIFENIGKDLTEMFAPMLEKVKNKDYSDAGRLKLIYKNNYVNAPNYGNFVESMKIDKNDSNLKLTIVEQKELQKVNETYAKAESGVTDTKDVKEKKVSEALNAIDNASTANLMTEL